MRKSVTVKYFFMGEVRDGERGVLLGDGKVFICNDDSPGVYNAVKMDEPNVYLVDLDNDGEDFYEPELLLDLLCA